MDNEDKKRREKAKKKLKDKVAPDAVALCLDKKYDQCLEYIDSLPEDLAELAVRNYKIYNCKV